jgi:cytochrome c oxidase cbb3-type subunit 3
MRLVVATLFSLSLLSNLQAAEDQGKVVYEAQCSPCHGMTGEGGYGAKLAVPHLAHARTKSEIFKVVQRGLPGTNMPSFGLLPDLEISQVAAYVQKLGRVSETPLPGDPLKGQAIFESNGCFGCHILNGKGSGFGPELTEVGIRRNFEYLRNKIVEPSAQVTEGFMTVQAVTADGKLIEGIRITEDPFFVLIRDSSGRLYSLSKSELRQYTRLEKKSLMPAYGKTLSDRQIDDLVSFLATRGRQ